MRLLYAVLVLALVLNAMPSHAQSAAEGNVTVEYPWARATSKGTTTAVVYLSVINNGSTNDTLISVTSEVSKLAQVHEEKTDTDGMTEMPVVDRLNIPAHGRVDLKPTGLHLMLLDLKRQLAYNTTFPITLSFENAGVLKVIVTVEKPGATTFDNMNGMNM
jgi:copper(I)-binding protein